MDKSTIYELINKVRTGRIKLYITMFCIMFLGLNWNNSYPSEAASVFSHQDSGGGQAISVKYNKGNKVVMAHNKPVNFQELLLENPKIEEPDMEELISAQEKTALSTYNALNTSIKGQFYAVKSEEAYIFGRNEGKKYVFLTFDDGPSPNVTTRILDTLKKYDVKATFFVLGKAVEAYPQIIKRELEEGHALANHTYTHNYKALYPKKSISVSTFSGELIKTQETVEKLSDESIFMRVIRFPGGSFEAWKKPMKDEITSKGMHFIDWNAENGDGLKMDISVDEQLENIKKHISWAEGANKNVVVLMHDAAAKKTTADALPKIIEYIKSRGYEFRTLK